MRRRRRRRRRRDLPMDLVKRAAEEAGVDLDQQAIDALVEELPDYETEVLEEGHVPLGPGEYLGGIPDSPPPPVLCCPIHHLPLHHNVSRRGWEYVACVEKECPVWASEAEGPSLCDAWELQACESVKEGPFTCHCDKPYKLALCQNSDKGNVGRLFLTCRQHPNCDFFQWADTPPRCEPEPWQPRSTRQRLEAKSFERPIPRRDGRGTQPLQELSVQRGGRAFRSWKDRYGFEPPKRKNTLTCDCHPPRKNPRREEEEEENTVREQSKAEREEFTRRAMEYREQWGWHDDILDRPGYRR